MKRNRDVETGKDVKKSRRFNARQIRSELSDPNVKDGVLDVPGFVKARKYEIDQLERSQLNSKYVSSTRVFQSLPRTLRRRAASHNVRRLPKRMRNRAIREMLSSSAGDISSLKKKTKSMSSKEIYRLKLSKNLLKLTSKMNLLKILPSEQLLNKKLNVRQMIKFLKDQIREQESHEKQSLKVKLNNTYGAYDNTGHNDISKPLVSKIKYLKRQKTHKWLSTHVWHAKRFHMLKRWGWNIPFKPTQKCFKSVHRGWKHTSCLAFDSSYECSFVLSSDSEQGRAIIQQILVELTAKPWRGRLQSGKSFHHGVLQIAGQVVSYGTVYCNLALENAKVIAFVQAHSSGFDVLWQFFSKHRESSGNKFDVYDCKYSLGSIDLTGPASLSALTSVLHGANADKESWRTLSQLGNVQSIGKPVVITQKVLDPRMFRKPSRTRVKASDDSVLDTIIAMNNGELCEASVLQNVFSTEGRDASYANMKTIKQINKRRQNPLQMSVNKDSDPQIPLVLFIHPKKNILKLIVPWFWVSPIWQNLVKVPRVLPCGMLQRQQINFEQSSATFPLDYPFTADGYIENELVRAENEKKWNSRPRNKRVNYGKLKLNQEDFESFGLKGELGNAFGCDWQFLRYLVLALKVLAKNGSQDIEFESNIAKKMTIWDEQTSLRKVNRLQDVYETVLDMKQRFKEECTGSNIPICLDSIKGQKYAEFNAKISELLQKQSVPAELYTLRLPVLQVSVKLVTSGTIKSNARIYAVPDDCVDIILTKPLDLSLDFFNSSPSFKYLKGFVTTGNMNFESGNYEGIGCVFTEFIRTNKGGYCIVRNCGSSTIRVGQIQLV